MMDLFVVVVILATVLFLGFAALYFPQNPPEPQLAPQLQKKTAVEKIPNKVLYESSSGRILTAKIVKKFPGGYVLRRPGHHQYFERRLHEVMPKRQAPKVMAAAAGK